MIHEPTLRVGRSRRECGGVETGEGESLGRCQPSPRRCLARAVLGCMLGAGCSAQGSTENSSPHRGVAAAVRARCNRPL